MGIQSKYVKYNVKQHSKPFFVDSKKGQTEFLSVTPGHGGVRVGDITRFGTVCNEMIGNYERVRII